MTRPIISIPGLSDFAAFGGNQIGGFMNVVVPLILDLIAQRVFYVELF